MVWRRAARDRTGWDGTGWKWTDAARRELSLGSRLVWLRRWRVIALRWPQKQRGAPTVHVCCVVRWCSCARGIRRARARPRRSGRESREGRSRSCRKLQRAQSQGSPRRGAFCSARARSVRLCRAATSRAAVQRRAASWAHTNTSTRARNTTSFARSWRVDVGSFASRLSSPSAFESLLLRRSYATAHTRSAITRDVAVTWHWCSYVAAHSTCYPLISILRVLSLSSAPRRATFVPSCGAGSGRRWRPI